MKSLVKMEKLKKFINPHCRKISKNELENKGKTTINSRFLLKHFVFLVFQILHEYFLGSNII